MGNSLNKTTTPVVEAQDQPKRTAKDHVESKEPQKRQCHAKHPVSLAAALRTFNEAKDPDSRTALHRWVSSEHFLSECTGQVDESWDDTQRKDVDRVVACVIDRHRGCLDQERLLSIFMHPNGNSLLRALFDRCDLRGMFIVTSLRHWLHWLPFPLPGESSKFSRLMDAWSISHIEQNKDDRWQLTVDDVCLLGYAVVMVNTDMTDARVKDKLSESQFVAQLNGTGCTETLAREIYRDVQKFPLVLRNPSSRCPCQSCLDRRYRKLFALTLILHDSDRPRSSAHQKDRMSPSANLCAMVDSFKAQSHFEPRLAREIVQFL